MMSSNRIFNSNPNTRLDNGMDLPEIIDALEAISKQKCRNLAIGRYSCGSGMLILTAYIVYHIYDVISSARLNKEEAFHLQDCIARLYTAMEKQFEEEVNPLTNETCTDQYFGLPTCDPASFDIITDVFCREPLYAHCEEINRREKRLQSLWEQQESVSAANMITFISIFALLPLCFGTLYLFYKGANAKAKLSVHECLNSREQNILHNLSESLSLGEIEPTKPLNDLIVDLKQKLNERILFTP